MSDPSDLLKTTAEFFRAKNEEYGGAYIKIGKILSIIFPDGVVLKTAEDHVRYNLFIMGINKYIRYGTNFAKGGHVDSATDMMAYAAMLSSFDETLNENPEPKGTVN
jgi:hypothetical protein